MSIIWHKLKSIYYVLRSSGYVVMYVNKYKNQEIVSGFLFMGLDKEEIILHCDTLADEMEYNCREEEDQIMTDRIGVGMINYINLN